MKNKASFCAVTALAVCVFSCVLMGQGYVGGFTGKVTKNYEPARGLTVVFTDLANGREYKTKTDNKGEYSVTGLIPSNFSLQIIGENKEVLYSEPSNPLNSNGINEHAAIELTRPEATRGIAGPLPGSKASKEEAAKLKAENEKIAGMNTQLTAAQQAIQAQNWPEVEKNLSQVLAKVPDTSHWEFYRALGEAQKNQNKNDAAIQSYTKGIQVTQKIVDGSMPRDSNNPYSDPAKAKMGMGAMLTSRGNLYLKQNKNDEAIADYKKAAESDPNPALAYYNLCAVEYNSKQYDNAAADCAKSTSADPNKADAWFFQGAALSKANKPGAADALNKYLQLEPNGSHAVEAKGMIK